MANLTSSKGYNTSPRISSPVGAFAAIGTADFGEQIPATPSLAYNSGAGSLAMSTAHVKVTWITANGESLPSAEATVSVSAGSGAVTVTQPTVPTNGAVVIGWRVYSSATTASEDLNAAALSTTQTQSTFTVNKLGGGTTTITGFPVATTAVQILIYGAGAGVPVVDNSGIQEALPSIAANSGATYYARVPNTGSQWKVQKSVDFMRADEIAETSGIILNHLDCVQPVYPGTATAVSADAYMVLNGYLFRATVAGTTATTFIGFAAFNLTTGATTTDGTVTWTSYGKSALVRFQYANVTGSTATPTAMRWELFEF